MDGKFVYIENVHNAPITCTGKDGSGKVLIKKFYHAMREKWTDKQITTGFEKLTEEEYEFLCKYSRAFIHYKDNPKKSMPAPLLILHEGLPPEAKAPHEALADPRKESRKAGEKIKELEGQIVDYKAKLLDAEEKYRTLQSASTDDEKLKPLNDQIAGLVAQVGALAGFTDSFMKNVNNLVVNDKVKAEDVKKFVETCNQAYARLSEKKKDFE
jgi:hypothetical protein